MNIHLRHIGQSILNTLFPRYCCVCGRRLLESEQDLCLNCLFELPMTNLHGKKGSTFERILWDDAVYTQHANSMLYYRSKSNYCRIYFMFKYHNHPEIAVNFGRMMAQELQGTDFFEGIDCMVPVPLSTQRMKQRGYNQSERLAYGISLITGIPIDTTSVIRNVDNPTQTHISISERRRNVQGIFELADAEALQNKHVLIVDDVISTGESLASLETLVQKAGGEIVGKMAILAEGDAKDREDLIYLEYLPLFDAEGNAL